MKGLPIQQRDIFIVGTARTAIGTFGGNLKDISNTQLATTAAQAAIERAGIAPDAVGHVVMGNVIPTDTMDAYLCAHLPEQYGGPGASVHFSFAVIEVLSRRDYGGFVGGLQVHNDIVPPYLLHYGTEAQRAYWLPRIYGGTSEIMKKLAARSLLGR